MLTATLSPTIPTAVNGTAPQALTPSPAPDISATLMVINQTMAQELLKNRLPNRPVSKVRVRSMIDDLRRDRWQTNGESIILDHDLRLLDGQHRLMAVSESGISITTLVVVGVDPSAMPSIDQGKAKGGADVLHMAELPHAQQLSSTAKWLWRFENQRMRQTTVLLRNDELPGFVAEHPGLSSSLEWGRSIKSLLPQGLAAMAYFLMAKQDAALSKKVFRALATGLEMSASDPIWPLRERFLKDKPPRTHAITVARCAALVLAWNKVREGAGSLVWRGQADPAVPFPPVR
jgi:hypothetical protein